MSFITAWGVEEPHTFITSEELETKLSPLYERLKLPFGRLELQTGIQSRGIWPAPNKPSGIAAKAAMNLFENFNVNAKDIDLLLYTGVCRDFLEPSTASVVHNHLKLPANCMSFDISNACLGFMSGIDIADQYIQSSNVRNVLIVTGENSNPLVEETIKRFNGDSSLTRKSIKKYFANLSIGSGAVAYLVSRDELAGGINAKLATPVSLSNTRTVEFCQGSGDTNGLMMETESEKLLHAGVELATETFKKFLDEAEIERDQIDQYIGHQVGVAHRNLLFKNLEIPLEKDFSTFVKYGNTGSAALPLTLFKAYENIDLSEKRVALMGIGSGLHCMMRLINF